MHPVKMSFVLVIGWSHCYIEMFPNKSNAKSEAETLNLTVTKPVLISLIDFQRST